MLLTGLGGVGRAWGDHIASFASRYRTIVPDHRGTGGSSAPSDGYTIAALASDMASLVRSLDCGPAHIVGSSTGGAIAQVMALDHADTVRSLVLLSSWAGPDPYFRRQFEVRKAVLERDGVLAYTKLSSLFLYSPNFARAQPQLIDDWIAVAAQGSTPPDVMAKRIDMILGHDERLRLHEIQKPCLVLVGDDDMCTPSFQSGELASLIPGAQLQVLSGGHLIYKEQPEAFSVAVQAFLEQQN